MRSHLYKTVQSIGGALVAGASISVYEPGSLTPIAQTLYKTVSGTGTWSNPFLAVNGVVDFYLDSPQDVDLVIAYGSSTLTAERQPVIPSAATLFASGAPITVTNGPSAGWLLQGTDSTHAQFVDPNSVTTNQPDTAMPTPSTPTIERRNGLAFVMWDGKDDQGMAMPLGFSHLVVQEVGDATRDLGALMAAGGVVPNADAGISLQFIAINTAGNAGAPSQLVIYPQPNAVVTTGPTQTTVGSAGGASGLPATPTKYMPIQADDGLTYLIPLYSTS